MSAEEAAEPLVVWSEAVREYDFGHDHPLTPRRFGPGIDLVRAAGATRFLEPREAVDEALSRLHERRYIRQVRSFSDDPWQPPAMGIGPGDCPPFHGMHEASALIAGGSIDAVGRILAGEADHAFNPGGGLHHAMAARASGFCIYNDVALGVAAARDAGHRVLYLDLDVHHGDGTQELFRDDPDVLTFSIHESGRSLFPGTGDVDEAAGSDAPGTVVNIPLEAHSGDASWLSAVESAVPALAEAFRPTFLVSQHGCDTHLLDPLAHLRVTTAAYLRATRMLDDIAHRWCEGRWLATGGGGYEAYRVVPRSWAIIWLAQAHREVPALVPTEWRARWASEAGRYDQAPLPTGFIDDPGSAPAEPVGTGERNARTAELALDRSLGALGSGRQQSGALRRPQL
jgi:acetoin utilization protein AcuC